MPNILPCPFCGSPASVHTNPLLGSDNPEEFSQVMCDLGHMLDCLSPSPQDAIDIWNTRTIEAPVRAEIELIRRQYMELEEATRRTRYTDGWPAESREEVITRHEKERNDALTQSAPEAKTKL